MTVKRIESRVGKDRAKKKKKKTAGLMEISVCAETYDGPSFSLCQVITCTDLS